MNMTFKRMRLTLDGHQIEIDRGLASQSVRFDGRELPDEKPGSAIKAFEAVDERPGGASVTYRIELQLVAFGDSRLTIRRDGLAVLELS